MAYPQSPQLHEFWSELVQMLPVKVQETHSDDDTWEEWANTTHAQQQVQATTSYWHTRRGQAAAEGPASLLRDYHTNVAIDASDKSMASMIDRSKPITRLKDMEKGKMYAANMTEDIPDALPKWAIMTITDKARKYAEIVGIKTEIENITPPGWEGAPAEYYGRLSQFLSNNDWDWSYDPTTGERKRDYVFTLKKYNDRYQRLRKQGMEDDDAMNEVNKVANKDALNETLNNLDKITGYPFPDLDKKAVRQWITTGLSPFSLAKVELWYDSPNEQYKKDRRVDPFDVRPGGYYNRPPAVKTWYPVRKGGPTISQRRKPNYAVSQGEVGLINWNLQDPEGL